MNYQRLRIIATLKSNPIINDELFFDGILYAAARKEQLGADWFNLQRFGDMHQGVLPSVRLPIKRQKKVYLASKACYKIQSEYTNHWRKRWKELSADRWCELKRVYINQKTIKNYNFPVNVKILKNNKIWWYCIGDKMAIERLLRGCYGIGKEQGQGYGLVASWEVKETFHKGVRLFPVMCDNNLPDGEIIITATCNPPYSMHTKRCRCVWRKF